MDSQWQEQVLRLKRRTTEAEDQQYRSLIEAAMGRCTLPVARVLIQTFSAEDDFGVQEGVVRVLASAEPEVYVRALLEHLPLLMDEAPNWATTLIGREVHNRSQLLLAVANRVESDARRALLKLITQAEFLSFYPNASLVASELEKQ